MNAIEKYRQKKQEMNNVIGGALKRRADEAVSSGLSEIQKDVGELYNSHSVLDKDWAGAQTFRNLKDERDSVISKTEDIKKWLPYSSYSAEDKNEFSSWINQIQGAIDSNYAIKDSSSDGQGSSALSLDEYAKQKQEYYSRYLDPVDFAKWSALESSSIEDIDKYIEDAKAEGYVKRVVRYGKVNTDKYIRQADIDRAQGIFDNKKYAQAFNGKTLAQIYENAYANFSNDHKEYTYLADNAGKLNRGAEEYEEADKWLNERKTELIKQRDTLKKEHDAIPVQSAWIDKGKQNPNFSQEKANKSYQLAQEIGRIEQEIEALDADMGKIYENKKISAYKEQYDSLPEDSKFLIDFFARVEDDPLLAYQTDDAQKAADIVGGFADSKSIIDYLVREGVVQGADDIERANAVRDFVHNRGYIIDLESAKNAALEQADFAKVHPVLASISSIPTSLVSGIAALPEVVRATVTGDDVNRYSAAFAPTRYTKTIRGTVSEEIEGEFGKFAYNTVMSMADSAGAMGIGIATGGITGAIGGVSAKAAQTVASVTSNVIMSSSAGANAIYEGLEKGYSSEKAVSLGVISGLIEAASEKFSIDTILNSVGKDSFWKTVGKSFIAEGSEEVVSNWGNKIADALANKSQSEIYQTILDYQDNGYSSSAALAHAVADSLGDDLLAFVAGGLSGAGMGVTAYAGKSILKNAQESVIAKFDAKSAIRNGRGEDLLTAALDLPKDSAEFKLAEKLINEGETKLTEANAKKLVKAVNRQLTKSVDEAAARGAKNAISQELQEKYNLEKSEADTVAGVAHKVLVGSELNSDEQAMYNARSDAQEIVQALQSNSDSEFSKYFALSQITAAEEAANNAQNVRDKITGQALENVVHPYISQDGKKVVRGEGIVMIDGDSIVMRTRDSRGADTGEVTLTVDDLTDRTARSIYGAVINATNDADVANSMVEVLSSDRSLSWASELPSVVQTAVTIARSGISLDNSSVSMFAGTGDAAWSKASDALKSGIYNAASKAKKEVGVNYAGSLSRADIVRAYAAQDKLGSARAVELMIDLIDKVGKKYGTHILFAELAEGYRGGHVSGTNTIVLGMDIESGLLTRTLGHEMFHYLKELNGTLAGQLQSDVISWLKKTGKYDAVYAQFEDNYAENTDGMSEAEKRAYLEEEIAADSCFDALSNDRFLADFYEKTAAKKNGKEFLQKLADFFRELSKMLRNAVDNFTRRYSKNELVSALNEDQKMLKHINEKFAQLLSETAMQQNKKSAAETQPGVKFSRKYDPNSDTNYVAVQISDIVGDNIKETDTLARKARLYLNQYFKGVVLPLGKTKAAYIRKEGINELTNPAKLLSDSEYRGKMLAATELDNLLSSSTYLRWENDDGRHPDVKRWIYYKTTFLFADENGQHQVIQGEVAIKRIARGDCFYDITKIENITLRHIGQSIINHYTAEYAKDVSTNIISDSAKNSNTSEEKNSGNSSGARSQRALEDEYSYDALISKPDMLVTRISDKTVYQANKADRKGIVDQAIQNVKQIGGVNEYGSAFVYVNDIKSDVVVTRKSVEHSLDRRLNIMGAVSKNIGSILQNSIRINELVSRSDNVDEAYILIGCAINQDGNPYIVRSVVNKYSNELSSMDVLYAVNAKKEPAALVAPRVTNQSLSITDSTISISDLLDFVNRYFPDILPEDVLRHYGHTARPDGVLGESALFQKSADSVRDEELRMIRQDYELTKLQNDLMRAKLKVYEHKVPSPKALRRYLNNVIKWYGVQYNDAEKLQAFEKLSEIYKYLVQSKTPNMATVQDMAFDLARDMIDYSAELIKEPYSDAERDLRRTLRETGLCLSEAQKSEIIYSYGSMTNFRRATGGMIRINDNSRLYVADIMREAKEIYDIKTDNEDEFLVELIPYMKASAEAARGVWADPYQGDAKAAHMAAMDLSSLLLDALFDPNIVPARRTFADMEEEKRYRALLNQYSYYEKRMAKLNDRVRQARAEGRQAVQNERGRREAAIKEMAEHYAQMTYKAQERRKSSELKAKIARLADSINGRLINPKKDRYIPQDIQQAIIPALELAANYTYGAERLEKYDRMIAAEPNEERRQRLVKTRDKIAKYGDNISSAIKDLKDLYDAGRPRTDSNGEELNADNPYDAAKQSAFNPAISELLNTVYNQLNGVSCNQMSSEQLQLLYNALRATDKVIRDSVNLRSSRIKMSVYEAGEELIRETSAIKGSKRGLASSLLQQNLNPESFFERLGGFAKNSLWMKTYDDLNDAQRDMLNLRMQGSKFFTDLLSPETQKSLREMVSEKNAADVGLVDKNGEKILLTHDKLVSLYLSMQSEDNLRHIQNGGICIAGKDGKVRAVGASEKLAEISDRMYDIRQSIYQAQDTVSKLRESGAAGHEIDKVKAEWTAAEDELRKAEEESNAVMKESAEATEKLRQAVEKNLTEYDRMWIQASQEFFKWSGELIDQTTFERYGFHKNLVENYFPISSDKDFTRKEIDGISTDMSLDGMGILKERVISGNPVIISGITSTVSGHLDSVSKYAGMSQAIDNFKSVYNVVTTGYRSSVKEAINDKFGKENGSDYLEKIIRDLVGATNGKDDLKTRAGAFMRGGLAAATLSFNIRVSLLQTASYPTAAAELGWKPIMKALARMEKGKGLVFGRAELEKIEKYSPLLWYRLQGYKTAQLKGLESSNKIKYRVLNSEKMRKYGSWINAMDAMTVGRLWYAAQYYVDDNFKELTHGSDEWYREVANAFNRTVERTQPNYTTLQRTAIARSDNEIAKFLSMFTTQRLQNFNIAYTAAMRYTQYQKDLVNNRNGVTKDDVKTARNALCRALSSLLAAAVQISVSRTLVQALLHNLKAYRDDDDELTAKSVALATLGYFAESMSSNVLFGSEIYSLLTAVITGEKYYTPELSGLNTVGEFAEDIYGLSMSLRKGIKNDDGASGYARWANTLGEVRETVFDICKIFGIPAKNAHAIASAAHSHAKSLFGAAKGAIDFKWTKYFDDDLELTNKEIVKLTDKRGKNPSETGARLFELYSSIEDEEKKSKFKSDAQNYFKSKFEENPGEWSDIWDSMQRSKIWKGSELNVIFRGWKYKIETGEDFNKGTDLYNAIRDGEGIEEAMEEYKTFSNAYTAEEDTARALKLQVKNNYIDGNIDRQTAIDYLCDYAGDNNSKARDTLASWDKAITRDDIKERFFSEELDDDEAISALCRAGYKRSEAEDYVNTWTADMSDIFAE